jgi:prepilin-type processing-associated H-X9-DG protein
MKRLADNYPQVGKLRFCPIAPYRAKNPKSPFGNATTAWVWDGPNDPTTGIPHWAGSYALNGWMYGGGFAQDNRPSDRNAFVKEGDIQSPSQTPVLAEGTWVDVWPQEKEAPARNLLDGGTVLTMSVLTIARHGAGPKASYATVSPGAKLPGAINISFCDGHVSQVPLEQLWQLHWHKTWQTPATRPR